MRSHSRGLPEQGAILKSNHYFYFIYVLFLIRVRKRTKKKRALRQGAGFSVNHSGGKNDNWVACRPFSSANTNALDGSTRKNSQYPRSPDVKCIDWARSAFPPSLPVGERAGERGLRGVWRGRF